MDREANVEQTDGYSESLEQVLQRPMSFTASTCGEWGDGLVAVESLASGTPVIATAAGGIQEYIDSEVGATFPIGDSAALGELVLRAIRENWKRTKGPIGLQRVRSRHSMEQWNERLCDSYRSVIDAHSTAKSAI